MIFKFNTDENYKEAQDKVNNAIWVLGIKIHDLPQLINMSIPTHKYIIEGEPIDNGTMLSLSPEERTIEISVLKYVYTVEEFWDCECEHNYIHHKCIEACLLCNTTHDEACDSRLDEVPDTFECTNCGELYVKQK